MVIIVSTGDSLVHLDDNFRFGRLAYRVPPWHSLLSTASLLVLPL